MTSPLNSTERQRRLSCLTSTGIYLHPYFHLQGERSEVVVHELASIEKLLHVVKPKLPATDELGYLPFEATSALLQVYSAASFPASMISIRLPLPIIMNTMRRPPKATERAGAAVARRPRSSSSEMT